MPRSVSVVWPPAEQVMRMQPQHAVAEAAKPHNRLSLLDHLSLGISNCRTPDQMTQAVVEAEGYGIGWALIAEDIGCRDGLQLAALAAARTSRICLALGVTNPYLRSPSTLAGASRGMSELSGGRFMLGLGSSSPDIITRQLGHDYGDRVDIMRRTIQAIRTSRGTRECPGRGDVDITAVMLAAMGPRMLRLAGEVADAVLLNTGTTPEYLHWALGHVDAGLSASGRDRGDIQVVVWLPVYIGPDNARAVSRARPWTARMLGIRGQGELLLERNGFDTGILEEIRRLISAYPHSGDIEPAAAIIPDSVVRRLAVIGGTVEDVVPRLWDYIDAGADTLVMSSGPLRKAIAYSVQVEGRSMPSEGRQ